MCIVYSFTSVNCCVHWNKHAYCCVQASPIIHYSCTLMCVCANHDDFLQVTSSNLRSLQAKWCSDDMYARVWTYTITLWYKYYICICYYAIRHCMKCKHVAYVHLLMLWHIDVIILICTCVQSGNHQKYLVHISIICILWKDTLVC